MICKYHFYMSHCIKVPSISRNEHNLTETALRNLFTFCGACLVERGNLIRGVCAKDSETSRALTCFNNRCELFMSQKNVYAWTLQHFRWFLLSLFFSFSKNKFLSFHWKLISRIIFFFWKVFVFVSCCFIYLRLPCVSLTFVGIFNIHTKLWGSWETLYKVLPYVQFQFYFLFPSFEMMHSRGEF